jgi:hypothetical protein
VDSNHSNPSARDGSLAPENTLCISCGYNLGRLALTALCPECATPVDRSVLGEALRYVKPEYVSSLARGFSYHYNGLLAFIVLLIIGGVVVGAMGGQSQALAIIVTILLPAAAIIAAQVGSYFIASRDPRGDANQATPIKSRQLLRYTAIAIVALTFVQVSLRLVSASAPYGLL